MKQDIRKLFDTEDETNKELPVSHRADFMKKLGAISSIKHAKGLSNLFKYAAAITLFIAIGFISYTQLFQEEYIKKESALEMQLKEVEKQYLENIEKEWQSFKALTNDEKLIERYEKELDELNIDYQLISKRFKANTNNIIIIENLVENLQTRLQLLKDIQAHIKLLNQKTKSYETIIL